MTRENSDLAFKIKNMMLSTADVRLDPQGKAWTSDGRLAPAMFQMVPSDAVAKLGDGDIAEVAPAVDEDGRLTRTSTIMRMRPDKAQPNSWKECFGIVGIIVSESQLLSKCGVHQACNCDGGLCTGRRTVNDLRTRSDSHRHTSRITRALRHKLLLEPLERFYKYSRKILFPAESHRRPLSSDATICHEHVCKQWCGMLLMWYRSAPFASFLCVWNSS